MQRIGKYSNYLIITKIHRATKIGIFTYCCSVFCEKVCEKVIFFVEKCPIPKK